MPALSRVSGWSSPRRRRRPVQACRYNSTAASRSPRARRSPARFDAEAAGLDEKTTAHVLRHTFATSLVRGGTDLVTVAELLGHSRLETVRIYTQPTEDDKIRALDHLIVAE
nr:tyrosine-type recombinase/integrase [Frankia sp. Cas3]